MQKTVSCIIPAYNESERISRVLDAVTKNSLVTEIVVVDDGSPDKERTKEIVSRYPTVRFIQNEKNVGKSQTVYNGIIQTSGEFLFFLDSDLIGLKSEDITVLITPALDDTAQMSISMRRNSPWIDRVLGIDFLSGERVFHRSFFEPAELEGIKRLAGYSLETYLNTLILQKNTSLAVVFWPEVDSPYPYEKRTFWVGVKAFLRMLWEIFRVVPFYKIPYLFYRMRRLIVRPAKN